MFISRFSYFICNHIIIGGDDQSKYRFNVCGNINIDLWIAAMCYPNHVDVCHH